MYSINQFKRIGRYSPVDQGVNGGKHRSEETCFISINPIQYCSVDGSGELDARKLHIGTFGAVVQNYEGSTLIKMNQYDEGI
jgi:hypothetical protein